VAKSCGRAQTRYASVSKRCQYDEAEWLWRSLQGLHQSQRTSF